MIRFAVLLFLASALFAQPPGAPSVLYVATNPSGACGPAYITENLTTGVQSVCTNGTWAQNNGPIVQLSGPVAPYSTTTIGSSPMTITAATHGQGALAVPTCFDTATPRVATACGYTRASNGDLVFTFTAGAIGEIDVGSGGGTALPGLTDCHLACSPSSAQLSNSIVANYGQGAANIVITGPTVVAAMNFIMIAGTAQASNSWRYTSTTANVYLDAAGPYTTVGFATPAVGNAISCLSFQIGASTYALRCTTLAGTSSGS
jgi:hypothetical protein